MKRVLIVGASSGIGRELAMRYIRNGYRVAGCARSGSVLEEMAGTLGPSFIWETLDLTQINTIDGVIQNLVSRLGGLDLCIVASSVSSKNRSLDWPVEKTVIMTNVLGYSAALVSAAHVFENQGFGHLAGISSVAKFFGNRNPAYNASKAFESIYLEGLRLRLEKYGIKVTEIIPGFVNTPLIADQRYTFWVVPVEKAAGQIIYALAKQKRTVYVSRRWNIFRFLLPLLPYALLRRLLP